MRNLRLDSLVSLVSLRVAVLNSNEIGVEFDEKKMTDAMESAMRGVLDRCTGNAVTTNITDMVIADITDHMAIPTLQLAQPTQPLPNLRMTHHSIFRIGSYGNLAVWNGAPKILACRVPVETPAWNEVLEDEM